MRIKVAVATAAFVVAGAAPASAAAADSCTLGSPNIIRDVTECAQYVLGGCNPGGSPNILTDILECLPR